VFVAVAIGGTVQIVPTLIVNRSKNIEGRLQELYTPLELAGRDIYVAEGCYNCHSQMIRTLVPEVMRYGRSGVVDDYSHLGESIYDHPYQWGSKRTGPDLAREGGPIAKYKNEAGEEVFYKYMRVGKRGNDWHFKHFLNPRDISGEASNMPCYPWLLEQDTDVKALTGTTGKIAQQRRLGVPWPAMSDDVIRDKALVQSLEISRSLINADIAYPTEKQLGIEREKLLKEGKSVEAINKMATEKRDEFLGIDRNKLRKGGLSEDEINVQVRDVMAKRLANKRIIALIAYMQKLGAHTIVGPDQPAGSRPLDPDSHRQANNP